MRPALIALALTSAALLTSSLRADDPAPATPATPLAITVRIDENKILNQTSDLYHGTNFVAFWNNVGNTPQTAKALAQSGLKLLRFPGGVPAEWYDWQVKRPPGWDNWTHEQAWYLAKAAGMQMLYQTNSAGDGVKPGKGPASAETWRLDSSGDHQAAWLTEAQDKAIKVAWWEIGNEPEMDAPGPQKKSQDSIMRWYNAKFEEQAKALKKVDPNAKIMAGSLTNIYFWWNQRNLEKLLAAEGNKQGTGLLDAISLHWYAEASKAPWTKNRSFPQQWYRGMDYVNSCIQFYDTRDLPVYITEWNFAGGMGKDASAAQFYTGLGNADIVGMFLKTGVKGHTHFCLHGADHNWGILYMKDPKTGKQGSEAAPTYYSLALAAKLWGHVLDAKPNVDDGNVLSAYAAQDTSNTLNIMLINKTENDAHVALSFAHLKTAGKTALLYTLQPAEGKLLDTTVIYNGVKDPQPQKDDLPAPAKIQLADQPSVDLKPYSMLVLAIPNAAPITAPYVRPIVPEATTKPFKIGQTKSAPPSPPQTSPTTQLKK